MNQIPFPNIPPLPAPDSRLLVPFQPGLRTKPVVVRDLSDDADPISVFFGKGIESAIDVASFGIFQPDIVPDWAERASPLATTLGSIAGSVAGFLPSFGASSVAAKGILGAFRYTRRIQEAGKMLETIPTARPFGVSLIQGATETGLTFAIHDAAREIVDQTKTNNLDIYEVAHKAVAGGLGGMWLGMAGKYTNYLGPATQAVSMGVTMTMAEVITDAAAGEDVLSSDYMKERIPTAFLTGAAIGLWNARGWKGRMEGMNTKIIDRYWDKIKREGFQDKDGNINLDPKGVIDVLKEMNVAGVENPQMIAAFRMFEKQGWMPVKEGAAKPEQSVRGRIKAITRTLGLIDENGKNTDAYRALLKEKTGKDSTKGMTVEEMTSLYNMIAAPIKNMRQPERSEPGVFAQIIGAPDRINLANGLKDVTSVPETARMLMIFEQKEVENVIHAYESLMKQAVDKYMPAAKPGVGELAKAFAKREPNYAQSLIADVIEGKIDRATLHPTINKIIDEYAQIAEIYRVRNNSVMIRIGKPELVINKRQNYMRHIIDRAALIKEGKVRSELPTQEALYGMGETKGNIVNPTAFQRQWLEKGEEGLPYIKNPWMALRDMVRNDLKTIYLMEPGRIFKQQVKELKEIGAIKPGEDKYLTKFYNSVILGQKSEKTAAISRGWVNMLSSHPGKFLDEYAAKIGIDLGDNPMQAINHLTGVSVTHAFLGFRGKMALRNATQFLFQHGLYSTESMAMGMNPFYNPKLFDDIKNKSLYRKMSGEGTEEEMGRVASTFGKSFEGASLGMFQQSNMASIDMSMKISYHEVVEKWMKRPKFRKYGWADEEGIRIRKETGNNELLSPRERWYAEQEIDHSANTSNFLYNVLGLPMITRSDVAAPFTKLMSFPMNYIYKYLGELNYRMFKGIPMWAKDLPDPPKIPMSQRLGLVKHFVGLSMFAAGMEAAFGIDFSSMLGASYNPNLDEKGERKGFQMGIFEVRPNPVTSMFLTLKDVWSSDDYTRNMARHRLKSMSAFPVPGIAAARDIGKLAETGEMKGYIFYEPRKPKAKKSKAFVPFPEVRGRNTFNPFE